MDISPLISRISKLESAVVASSGGLDSSLLLYACVKSGIRVLAVTGSSESVPARDLEDAVRVAQELGVEHRFIETGELEQEGYLSNPPERCFHCKDDLFTRIREIAEAGGFAHVLDGTNADDLLDHRPGIKAAKEHGIMSPLADAGLTKEDVREAARACGLSVAEKPASPCLSSRFPYGVRITREGLHRVEQAEGVLRGLGFDELRVRDNGGEARIEVSRAEMQRLFELREEITASLLGLGYKFVSLDLEGLESGKLNRALNSELVK